MSLTSSPARSPLASPRPSINLPSSRRGSNSTITSIRSTTPSIAGGSTASTPVPHNVARRNRAALREFYNLAAADGVTNPDAPAAPAAASTPDESGDDDPLAALDAPAFAADKYAADLLATSTPEALLRTLSQITTSALALEGDKKALVYDNYTTLLSATSTISKMRRNVDPMAPVTTTLEPAVAHIAEVAGAIASGRRRVGREAQQETVRWVLGAPGRLRGLKEGGQAEEAGRDWAEVRGLLQRWEGVKGVDEVRKQCEQVMGAIA